ncbi:MAG: putative holin [Desulfovibrio sp.]
MFSLSRLPRMTTPSLVALALLALVALAAPQQLPIIAYKLALVVGAGVAGYGLDRALFPYARPHAVDASGDELVLDAKLKLFLVAQGRRAVIVAAAMVAVGLGL